MILCCGEALVDVLPAADGDDPFAVPGGSIFNTAVALGRLGAPAGFFGGLSSDTHGDLLRKTLAAAHVDASLAVTSDRPTTRAIVNFSAGQPSYTFKDEGSAGRMLTTSDLPATIGADVLLFGGISLIEEPCATAYASLLMREAGTRTIMLDPNIRPGFIADPDAHRDRIRRMAKHTDILKLSVEDATWLDGAAPPDAFARRWLARGPSLVVITDGPRGATAWTARHSIAVQAPAAEVVDTVGAGDTFNAGLITALMEAARLDRAALRALSPTALSEALHLAVAAASASVARAGAHPPWRHELADGLVRPRR